MQGEPEEKKQALERARDKLSRVPLKVETKERLRKPDWIRVRVPNNNHVELLKNKLRENRLVTVCEEASCPNLPECFGKGTATFMIMGDKCTRRCTFCDVAHGRPDPLDPEEPLHLAQTIADMKLKYVVVTSVDRDDLRDGGAGHFAACIDKVRELNPKLTLEVLVPDFRGRGRNEKALDIFADHLPDVFNHNIETISRLYPAVRPGSDYQWSLNLLADFKARFPHILTKSGAMLGLGERKEEIFRLLDDLAAHQVDMVTLGQYLQPSVHHIAVDRYVHPDEFAELKSYADGLGFKNVASGPMVRSSYHADQQAAGIVGE